MATEEDVHDQYDVQHEHGAVDHGNNQYDVVEEGHIGRANHDDGVEAKGHGEVQRPELIVLIHLVTQQNIGLIQLAVAG